MPLPERDMLPLLDPPALLLSAMDSRSAMAHSQHSSMLLACATACSTDRYRNTTISHQMVSTEHKRARNIGGQGRLA
jgi:hypothetical protein